MSFLKSLANNITNIGNLFKVKDVSGFENLQNIITTKKQYLEKVISCLNNLNNSLKTFYETVSSSEKILNSLEDYTGEKKINDAALLICKKIKQDAIDDNNLLISVMKNMGEHLTNLNKEINCYDQFKKINRDLQKEKDTLIKNKNNYHKLGKGAENKIKSLVKHSPKEKDIFNSTEYIEQLDLIGSPAKEALIDYNLSLKKTNELVNQYNKKQMEIYDILPKIGEKDLVFDFELLKLYQKCLEAEGKYINNYLEEFKKSKIEVKSELKDMIEMFEENKKEEKIINLSQYQTELDINKCQSDEDFEILHKTIELITLYIDESIFPDYKFETEQKVFNIHQILRQLFKETGEIDSKLREDFLNGLKDPIVHVKFYILLSQLRTNNKFLRTKYLIEILGEGFQILLEEAGRNKLYDNIKNCIILSQTFYYEGENKKKIYIFEMIKNNKYLSNSHFWRDFIEDMIKKEFVRLENILPDINFSVEKNINITPKIKEKLNEAVFSQLITYASNMKDFGLDKRVIIKIIQENLEKYNYLSENNIKNIYLVIAEEESELEKLKKEYNPSLESELIIEEEKTEKNNTESVDKENKEQIPEVKENKEQVSEVKDNKEEQVSEVKENKEKVPEVKEDKEQVPEVKENKEQVSEVKDNKEQVPEVKDDKEQVNENKGDEENKNEINEEKKPEE